MKVHLVLKETTIGDASAVEAVLEAARAQGFQADANQALLADFGIVLGEIPPAALPKVQAIEGVQAVEPDRKKYAL